MVRSTAKTMKKISCLLPIECIRMRDGRIAGNFQYLVSSRFAPIFYLVFFARFAWSISFFICFLHTIHLHTLSLLHIQKMHLTFGDSNWMNSTKVVHCIAFLVYNGIHKSLISHIYSRSGEWVCFSRKRNWHMIKCHYYLPNWF